MDDLLFAWFAENQIVVWLLIALFSLLLEMSSPGLFFFLSFFFGALVAAGVTLVSASWALQALIFLGSTACAFVVLHYWLTRKAKGIDVHTQTNVYALRSKRGRVIRQITADKMGLVKIDGEKWSARSLDKQTINEGSMVTVERVKGVHLVVKQVKSEQE